MSSKTATQNVEVKTSSPLWKKIVLIASLSIIAAIIITIVIFACVGVDLKPNKLSFNSPYGVQITGIDGTSDVFDYSKDDQEFLNIVEKINKGFSTNFLTGFTEGINGDNKFDVTRYSSSTSKSSLVSGEDVKYTLEFRFSEDQKIYKPNGEVFTAFNNIEQTYRKFVMVLEKHNSGFGLVNIWFFSESNETNSYINLSGYGNFMDLIKYLDKIAEEF